MKKAIVHIKIGAEKYWEEVKGFVSGDKKSLFFKIKDYDWNLYRAGKDDFEICENDNHPLSKLANKLGATLYGGFEDEKDFYLMMPTVEGFKVGDVNIFDFYGECKYSMLCFGEFEFCEDFHNTPSSSTYGFYWKENDDYDKLYSWHSDQSVSKNIFQEYARTGVIENDLYKHFFK